MRIIILMLSLVTAVITLEYIQDIGFSQEKLRIFIISSTIFILCIILEVRKHRKTQREIKVQKENLEKLSRSIDRFIEKVILRI